MSYTVTATQARLFGFTPKYAWDEFVAEYDEVGREIKKKTFQYFMEIEANEIKIKKESNEVLRIHGINAGRYCMEKKEEKKQLVESVRREIRPEMKEDGLSGGENRGGSELGEGEEIEEGEEGDVLEWDKTDEVEKEMDRLEGKWREDDEDEDLEEYLRKMKEYCIRANGIKKELEKKLREKEEEVKELKGEIEEWRCWYATNGEEELTRKKQKRQEDDNDGIGERDI
jgi:hypothetical protein